jgi:hypothetical protein
MKQTRLGTRRILTLKKHVFTDFGGIRLMVVSFAVAARSLLANSPSSVPAVPSSHVPRVGILSKGQSQIGTEGQGLVIHGIRSSLQMLTISVRIGIEFFLYLFSNST